jgi:hypothetical protein
MQSCSENIHSQRKYLVRFFLQFISYTTSLTLLNSKFFDDSQFHSHFSLVCFNYQMTDYLGMDTCIYNRQYVQTG